MSGYGHPTSYLKQSDLAAYTTAFPGAPQYTPLQINQYFVQNHCYPPQPYLIIPRLYAQPIVQPVIRSPIQSDTQSIPTSQSAFQLNFDVPLAYEKPTTRWPSQASPCEHFQNLTQARSQSHSQRPARSNSRARTWTCNVPHCTSSARFTRLADVQRHQATVHGMGTPEFPCTIPHCSRVGAKGFTRRDHLIEHLRNFHKVDVPKRKAGERSAFLFGWPEGMGGDGSRDTSD